MYRAYQVTAPPLLLEQVKRERDRMNISLHPRCLSLIPGNNINLGFPPFFLGPDLVKMKFSVSNER